MLRTHTYRPNSARFAPRAQHRPGPACGHESWCGADPRGVVDGAGAERRAGLAGRHVHGFAGAGGLPVGDRPSADSAPCAQAHAVGTARPAQEAGEAFCGTRQQTPAAVAGLGRRCAREVERKAFFSEEKKQKTFVTAVADSPARHNPGPKVFWFFFSKKNCFLPTCSHAASPAPPPDPTPPPADVPAPPWRRPCRRTRRSAV